MIRVGCTVETEARGYGKVMAINVTVPHLGKGLVAVQLPYDGVLYYPPSELWVVG